MLPLHGESCVSRKLTFRLLTWSAIFFFPPGWGEWEGFRPREILGCWYTPSITKSMQVFFMSLMELVNIAFIFLTISQKF